MKERRVVGVRKLRGIRTKVLGRVKGGIIPRKKLCRTSFSSTTASHVSHILLSWPYMMMAGESTLALIDLCGNTLPPFT